MVPSIDGLDAVDYMTSHDALYRREQPAELARGIDSAVDQRTVGDERLPNSVSDRTVRSLLPRGSPDPPCGHRFAETASEAVMKLLTEYKTVLKTESGRTPES